LVTLSIGGNDAGFSNVIINCALYYFTCGSAISEANSYIANKLPGVLNTTYNNVKAKATTAKIIILGYPHLFTDTGSTCNANFLTSGNEKKLNETGDKLDAAVKAQAESHGFSFVDPRSAFKAHEVCASEEWLNGQSNPLEESYHPNVKGYVELRKEVEALPLP
jgi:lysophospholipase L1-like esterase